MGKVVLAGAGPGDTGLLTLKTKAYVENADCLVYDRLLSPKLLDLTKPGCEQIYVGKENHKHIMKQEDINQLLFEKSRQYELVVRLKGGDPYVFGRGGEEALYLVERQVPVEVVPGVSSSIAALADAGIPITHRGIAKGFQVITAHSRKDEEMEIDYSRLTDETVTCVFLMGLAHVKSIAAGLIKAGRSADTPIAVISNGTTPTQSKCVGTLENIGVKMEQAKLKSPATIVVGNVVALQDKLNFFEKRPLFGRKIVVPYIEEDSALHGENRIISKLEELGADVLAVKVGRIEPVIIEEFEKKISSMDWILFTSKNGVKAFFFNLKYARMDVRKLAGCKFGVVGKHTAEELEKHNLCADFIPKIETGEGFATELREHFLHSDNDENVCLFSAKEASQEVIDILQGCCHLHKIAAYENIEVPVEKEIWQSTEETEVEAVFTSASNVKRFFLALPKNVSVKTAYSIGPMTTQALQEEEVGTVVQAEACSYDAIVEKILDNRKRKPQNYPIS
ncbi:MAG: uroporphyrinogen-III C-methyltransferase [Roseburia sp.]|nr:uroporphyrinogen-III C-methyltransferase [Roseburia sp.]